MATKKSEVKKAILLKSELPDDYEPKLGDLIRHKSGRVHEYVMKEGRLVHKWRSDRPDKDGNHPLKEFYLVADPVRVLEDGKLVGYICEWITREQLEESYAAIGKRIERGGIEDLLHLIAKKVNSFQSEHVDKKSYIVRTVLNAGIGFIKNELLNEDLVFQIVDGFLSDKLS